MKKMTKNQLNDLIKQMDEFKKDIVKIKNEFKTNKIEGKSPSYNSGINLNVSNKLEAAASEKKSLKDEYMELDTMHEELVEKIYGKSIDRVSYSGHISELEVAREALDKVVTRKNEIMDKMKEMKDREDSLPDIFK